MSGFSRPSSQVLKQIEAAVLRRHELQINVDRLLASIAFLNTEAENLAVAEFGPDIAPWALKMAEGSLPSIISLSAEKLDGDAPVAAIAPSVVPAPVLANDSMVAAIVETPVPSSQTEVDNDPVADNDDFFGVPVPSSRIAEGYAIVEEALICYRQGQKSNPYGSDRGKNSFRKQLFARALESYYENGLSDGPEQPVVNETIFVAEVDFSVDGPATSQAAIEEPSSAIFVVEAVETVAIEEVSATVETIVDDLSASAPDFAPVSELEATYEDDHTVNGVDGDIADGSDDDFLPDFGDHPDDDISSGGHADEVPQAETFEALSQEIGEDFEGEGDPLSIEETLVVEPGQTFELGDTFFSDEQPEPEPLVVAEEQPQVVVPASVVPEAAKTPVVADDMVGGGVRLPPSAAARVVSVASLPPSMRPVPSMRPQPSPVQSVGVKQDDPIAVNPAPAAPAHAQARPPLSRPPVAAPTAQRPAATAQQVTSPSTTEAAPVAEQAAPKPHVQGQSPSPALVRPGFTPPPRPGAVRQPAPMPAQRQHGYGAAVPGPSGNGLEQALEEKRKAEEAKAAANAAAGPGPAAAAPRPAAPPMRPSFAAPIRR
jgi:hypothetical protein